jgi:cyclohexyl-isocyanide hydratase
MTLLDLVGPMQAWSFLPGYEAQYAWHRAGLCPLIVASTSTQRTLSRMLGPSHRRPVCRRRRETHFGACCKIRLRWPFWLIADRAPRWVSSVCTGSLLLGAAGLLRGYRAAVHWGAREALGQFGAVPSNERVHIDRNRFTRGGNYSGGRSWYRYRLEMGWREHGASNRADYGIRAATAVSHGAT